MQVLSGGASFAAGSGGASSAAGSGGANAAAGSAGGGAKCAWKEELAEQGFVVFPAHIGQALAKRGAGAIRSRVQHVLKLYGIKDAKDVGSELRHAAKHFGKSPPGWTGPAFGGFDKRGWQISVGNGRMFANWSNQDIFLIREATRSIACDWHGVPGSTLQSHPESCSMKVSGCPALAAHVDGARVGTLQIVIALSKTKGIVWPGSHKHGIGQNSQKFYKLTNDDFNFLKSKGCEEKEVDLDVGDVLVFLGGVMVHGSPAIGQGEAPRIMTYAHWLVKDAPGSAEGSGAAASAEGSGSHPGTIEDLY